MGLFTKGKKEIVHVPLTSSFPLNGPLTEVIDTDGVLKPKFKGEVSQTKITFPAELGEEHPFDFSITEGLYRHFGMVTGVVDKYIDFIVGGGFYVKSENEKALKIINRFMETMNFDTLLRAWIKEALTKGTGFLEMGGEKGEEPQGMKILDAKWMYINRDNKGKLEGYSQFKGGFNNFDKTKIIPFKPFQIAALPLNTIGDDAYGLGIISPSVITVDNLIAASKDMHILTHRKANAPIHVKLGDKEKGIIPTDVDVKAYGNKLETLNNKNEWVTDPFVEMNVLEFGKIADNFSPVIDFDINMLIFTYQVPEVLLGRGNIPEGLAKEQREAFELRTGSLQAEVEKVIENEIFKRVLTANGIGDVKVEFEWGEPNLREKNERIRQITELLKLSFMLNPGLKSQLEFELADLFGFNVKELETAEQEKDSEKEEPQPQVPGQNQNDEQKDIYQAVFKGRISKK